MKAKYYLDYRLTGKFKDLDVIYSILTTKSDKPGVEKTYRYEDIFIAGKHYRRKINGKSHKIELAIEEIKKYIKIGLVYIPENWEKTI